LTETGETATHSTPNPSVTGTPPEAGGSQTPIASDRAIISTTAYHGTDDVVGAANLVLASDQRAPLPTPPPPSGGQSTPPAPLPMPPVPTKSLPTVVVPPKVDDAIQKAGVEIAVEATRGFKIGPFRRSTNPYDKQHGPIETYLRGRIRGKVHEGGVFLQSPDNQTRPDPSVYDPYYGRTFPPYP